MASKAFKFRLYPNQEQAVLLSKTFGCVRFVYNRWLDRKIKQYEEDKTTVTYTMCAREMAELKNEEGLIQPSKTFFTCRRQDFRDSNLKKAIETVIQPYALMET